VLEFALTVRAVFIHGVGRLPVLSSDVTTNDEGVTPCLTACE